MSEKIHADVLSSFLDFRAVYQDPIFDFLRLYGQISQSVYRAFRGWNVTLDNISSKQNPANFGDISTTFSFPGGRIAFSVGLGACSLGVANPDWSEANMVAKIAEAGISALRQVAEVTIGQHKGSIGIHVKPSTGSIKDVVSNLFTLRVDELGSNVRAYGLSIYREGSSWVVDASVVYQDALFIRIDRTWGPGVALDQAASQLNADEARVLDVLRLEVG